jgi:hypothetical protein
MFNVIVFFLLISGSLSNKNFHFTSSGSLFLAWVWGHLVHRHFPLTTFGGIEFALSDDLNSAAITVQLNLTKCTLHSIGDTPGFAGYLSGGS